MNLKELKELHEKVMAEDKAYENLVRKGYIPQGRTTGMRHVVIKRDINNDRDVYFFNSYQEADENLKEIKDVNKDL